MSSHENEKLLQQQVLARPSLLPTSPSIALVEELTLPGVGRVDLVGVAEDGRVWVIECKLQANPQIRREIVGQVLAYAGGLWQMSYSEFQAAFSARAGKSLHTAVEEAVGHEVDAEQLSEGVTASLNSGQFTLVLAVDSITDELKRIVEFLDLQTSSDVRVMALELAYFKEGDIEILNPVTYGDQLTKAPGPHGPTVRWNRETFTAALEALPDASARSTLTQVLAHGDTKGKRPFWGSGGVPGMSYYYELNGKEAPVWAMYLRPAGAVVAVSFGSIAHVSKEKAKALLEELLAQSAIAPFLQAVDPVALRQYPNIPVTALSGTGVEELLAAIDKTLLS